MRELLVLQFSIFAMLAVGFALRRGGMVTAAGQRELTDLTVNVVLPCSILTSFLGGLEPSALRECGLIFAVSLASQVFCVFYGRLLYARQPEKRRCCLEYGTICSNGGFLGSALAEGLYGAQGLMYASVYLIPLRVMMWSAGLAAFAGEKDWRATVRKVALHPCILACGAGLALMLSGLSLPPVLLTPVQAIGRCNTALSMMVVGMILGQGELRSLAERTVAAFTVHRLVVIPLAVYLLCLLLPMGATARSVSVLLAAMPAGATTSMLAAKYGCEPEFATKLVVFSTLCSIPAIAVWSLLLGGAF